MQHRKANHNWCQVKEIRKYRDEPRLAGLNSVSTELQYLVDALFERERKIGTICQ